MSFWRNWLNPTSEINSYINRGDTLYIRKIEINKILLVCLITISIISIFIKEACNTKVQASSLFMGDGQTKVVLITVDYMNLEDFSENSYLKKLFDNSYSALVSGRQNGKATVSKAKLSVGTGKRFLLSNTPVIAVNSYMGSAVKTLGQVKYQDINEVINVNRNSEYIGYIGYLGDKLNSLDKTASILGNSDTDVINRDNVLIAMDGRGCVDYGDVEGTMVYDESFPGGKRTDFSKLAEEYRASLPISDLVVVDTGDLARLESYRNKLTEIQYEGLREQTIERITEYLRAIIDEEKSNISFVILSAYPDLESLKQGNKLTPILSYEPRRKGGVLYSGSTRREGIISNLDIADYILAKLEKSTKCQLREIETENDLNNMLNFNRRILNVSAMRLPVLTWYAVLEIVCGVLGLLYMLNMKLLKNKRLLAFIKAALLVNISAPVVFLYMAALDIDNPIMFFSLFILAGCATVFAINLIFTDSVSRFAAAALIVNVSLIVDLLRNSFLIKSSVFGYVPIIGARFYGVGNEFAGVYIGSSILLAGCLLQRFREHINKRPVLTKVLMLIYFAFQVYMIGMPSKGANFGATIAAVCGYFFFVSSVNGKRVNIKGIAVLALLVVLVLGIVVFMDFMNTDNTTHIGRFISDIRENGIKVLLSTFGRKLAMNLKLIRYTIWTKVLLCIILIITIMFFKPVRLLHGIFIKYRYIAAAWLGISVSSIAGLIVNDSGIVMAATAMIFTGYTILYMCLEELQTVKSGG